MQYRSLPFLVVSLLLIISICREDGSSYLCEAAGSEFESEHEHEHEHDEGVGESFKFQLIHRSQLQLPNNWYEKAREEVTARRREAEVEIKKDYVFAELPLRSAAVLGKGEYFVSVRIGSPPRKFLLYVDTGSDLTWVKCWHPLANTEERVYTGRYFNSSLSRTFKGLPCSNSVCNDLKEARSFECPGEDVPCAYEMPYQDGTRAQGMIARETISIRDQQMRKLRLRNVLIGCTDWLTGGFGSVDGILGLGFREESFVSKIARSYGLKFSYCFADFLSREKNLVNYLSFGNSSVVRHLTLKYTQLLSNEIPSFYALNCTGISVDGVRLNISRVVWKHVKKTNTGGMIIDTGASLTFLTTPAYTQVMDALTPSLRNLTRVMDPEILTDMSFCFDTKGYDESMVPRLVFHFGDGATFRPPVKNYILDPVKDVKCIGFARTQWPGGYAILGNMMQQNHYWEYDISQQRLGFAASACNEKD